MDRLLRYITLITLFAVALISGAKASDSFLTRGSAEDLAPKIEQAYFDDTNDDSILCHLRYATRTTSVRHLSSFKRTNNAHRHNFEFIKSGKTINPGVINFIHKESLIVYVSFIGSVGRFIRLGKLVI